MRVAIIAPPWLSIPPKGYGGIETVLDGLIKNLVKQGVSVEVFSVGTTKIRGVKIHSLYKTEQFADIYRPMFEALPILGAHLQYALDVIKKDGGFDVIHDHNGYLGPQVLSWATRDKSIPPVLYTLHGPPFSNRAQLKDGGLPDNRLFWKGIMSTATRFYINGISQTLMKTAPRSLTARTLAPVYNAINPQEYTFVSKKKSYFLTLARFSAEKGQHTAVKLCNQLGYPLQMAGTVAGIMTPRQLSLEIANPLSAYRTSADFKYYSDRILPYTIENSSIKFLGNVSGKRKQSLIGNARALLFPIEWEEPFGMAVIEALACGTPVVAMNRGAMPEIITHGVNGFLANNEKEFAMYMQRVDEIHPDVCRKSVEEKFSADVMASEYAKRYEEVLQRSRRRSTR